MASRGVRQGCRETLTTERWGPTPGQSLTETLPSIEGLRLGVQRQLPPVLQHWRRYSGVTFFI